MTRDVTRALLRLLRFMGPGLCRIEPGSDQAICRVLRADGQGLNGSPSLLSQAAALGLVTRSPGGLVATPEAKAFVRRHMSHGEDAFLDQHRDIEIVERDLPEGGRGALKANAAESPLAQLARLKDKAGSAWFSPEAIAAGERLARDFQFANLQPKITARYEPRLGDRPGVSGGVELKDSVVAARIRVSRAVEAMGPDLAGVALDICCFEKGLEVVERERQWPARSAKLMLRTALGQLSRHYNPPAPPRRQSHHWGAEGYRPDLP